MAKRRTMVRMECAEVTIGMEMTTWLCLLVYVQIPHCSSTGATWENGDQGSQRWQVRERT